MVLLLCSGTGVMWRSRAGGAPAALHKPGSEPSNLAHSVAAPGLMHLWMLRSFVDAKLLMTAQGEVGWRVDVAMRCPVIPVRAHSH